MSEQDKPKLIRLDQPAAINLRETFMGGKVLETIMNHEARPKQEIFREVAGIISAHSFRLEEGQTPMAVVEGTPKSEVNMLLRTLKRLNLVPIDETIDKEISEHLEFFAGEGLFDVQEIRQLKGMVSGEFARKARAIETIVFGDLDAMSATDPAQKFFDGSFYNNSVISINGHDKIHVREHLTALRENRAPQGTAQILEFKPRI